jgi:hypothetical protein
VLIAAPMGEPAAVGQLTGDSLRLLADPSQEVLLEQRPVFSQLAPVPLLNTDNFAAAELSRTSRDDRQDSSSPASSNLQASTTQP